MAIQNGDQETVRLLADVSADLNSPNYSSITPLAAACKLQDWKMVNLLLDLKVNKLYTTLHKQKIQVAGMGMC